jgi:DNA-binding response OmpR family regulator
VLVVEKDDAVGRWLSRVLTAAGHSVHWARGGAELPALVDEVDPEVVVSDPAKLSVLELEAALSRGSGAQIVLLSSYSTESGVRALSPGFHNLLKPVPVRMLQETVFAALVRRRSDRDAGPRHTSSGIRSRAITRRRPAPPDSRNELDEAALPPVLRTPPPEKNPLTLSDPAREWRKDEDHDRKARRRIV